MDPAIIGGGLRLLGGLLGRKKSMTPSQSIVSQADGARHAAEKYGFNPLTMLQYGQPAGAMGGGGDAPPLASLAILGDIIEENYGQDAQDRREHNRLTNELLSLEVARARTLGAVAPVSAVAGIGGGAPALNGGRTSVIGTDAGVSAGTLQMKVLGDREVRQAPTEDMSGFMRIRNGLTDEDGFLVPGSDGEPLDIWQVPVVAGSWLADKAWDVGTAAGDWLAQSDSSPLQRPAYQIAGYTEDGHPYWLRPGGVGFQLTKPTQDDYRAYRAKSAE